MRFYSKDECEEWLRGRDRVRPDQTAGIAVERIGYPPEPYKFFYFAHWIATSLTYRMPTLLWMTEWSIWPSSENWHLYYKLRQSYGDRTLLHEAPGHLFLEHEAEDLASFLQIGMLNGWGGYVLTHANYMNAFFSHDEYIDFFAKPEIGGFAEVREALSSGNGTSDRSRIPTSHT
ncbi:MAG: hypothetical protein ABSG11_20770 [Candidatus Korobacteraceae bacterium]|jgi:hypothetical protein